MTKEALRKLQDGNTDVGRQILQKLLDDEPDVFRQAPFLQPAHPADDDQSIDAE